MTKSFKYFRKQNGSKPYGNFSSDVVKPVYKHSIYMQSKDSTWITRNTKPHDQTDEPNSEEDLRG